MAVYSQETGTVDWNGGIGNSPKMRSKGHSTVQLIFSTYYREGIQIDGSMNNYTLSTCKL